MAPIFFFFFLPNWFNNSWLCKKAQCLCVVTLMRDTQKHIFISQSLKVNDCIIPTRDTVDNKSVKLIVNGFETPVLLLITIQG